MPLGVEAGDTLPHGAAAQDTLQLTPALVASSVTVAVSWVVLPASTWVGFGVTETVTPGTVMVPELDTEG